MKTELQTRKEALALHAALFSVILHGMRKRLPLLAAGLILAIACGRAQSPPHNPRPPEDKRVEPAPQKFTRLRTLHTIEVQLTVYAASEAKAQVALDAGFARVEELFTLMDDYHLDSPLNQFCAKAGKGPVKVAPDLMAIFIQAKRMAALTGGAFDITVKPFTQLWRLSRERGQLPPPQAIARAREFVGIDKLVLHPQDGTAELTKEGMWLDLGGIAKGYMGDEAVKVMAEKGCPVCACYAGGDRVFGDSPPDSPEGWPVEVPDATPPISFKVKNGAASVSGDVFRFVEIDGVRYSHVIDPKTGLGIATHKMACVRARRGMDTDPLVKGGSLMEEAAWQKAVAQVEGGQGWVFVRAGK